MIMISSIEAAVTADLPAGLAAAHPPKSAPVGSHRGGQHLVRPVRHPSNGCCCEQTRQPVVQGRSFSGLRTAQMRLIRSPAISNANTVTVTPSC
jgi:hypothetical protein